MKIIGEIENPYCKISVFQWNHKYLVKFEHDSMEQIFKISQWEVRDENELRAMINDDFIQNAMKSFAEMKKNIEDATKKFCG